MSVLIMAAVAFAALLVVPSAVYRMTATAELAMRFGIGSALILPELKRLPPPELFPKRLGWVVRKVYGARTLDVMQWGFPLAVDEGRVMPLGRFYSEEGLLLRQRGSLILQRDDGGRWRLAADDEAECHLGQRVRVEGIKSGFDLLEVTRIVGVAK